MIKGFRDGVANVDIDGLRHRVVNGPGDGVENGVINGLGTWEVARDCTQEQAWEQPQG